MEEEFRENDGGELLSEFMYVAQEAAQEDPMHLPSTQKFYGMSSISGIKIVRDHGHAGMTLQDFCDDPRAMAADLTLAEVAALRLYSGPAFRALNYACRMLQVEPWATTIACCFSGILKLSFLSQPTRVYRGVREADMKLPPDFLGVGDGKFAGGIERSFMSTTSNPGVALDYSGGALTEGTILVIDFDMTSRGADISFLSQYPHEAELLFPPCTGLTCYDVSQRGNKRCVMVAAHVSTARPNTAEVETPHYVPGSSQALAWAAACLHLSPDDVASKTELDMSNNNFEAHTHKLALLVGRSHNMVSGLSVLALNSCQLGSAGMTTISQAMASGYLVSLHAADNLIRAAGTKALADVLALDKSLTVLTIHTNEICDFDVDGFNFVTNSMNINLIGVVALSDMLKVNQTLTSLDIESNRIGPQGMEALAAGLTQNTTLSTLNVANNRIGPDAGAEALASILSKHPKLSYVNAGAPNDFADTGGVKLAAGIKFNSTLTSLNLGGNPFAGVQNVAQDGAVAILESCRSRLADGMNVLEVNLRGNLLDFEDMSLPEGFFA